MPKSRGRKPKPSKKLRTRSAARASGPDRYTSGVVEIDLDEGMLALASLSPEQLVEIGLSVWWLMLQQGNPAHMCLDGALVLRTAYAQFGITAVPKLVQLVVTDPASDHATHYGTRTPHIDSRNQFIGHMGLWLPQSCNFIDHTVQQFPEVRAVYGWPMVVLLGVDGITDWNQVQGGFTGPRGRLKLKYYPLPEEDNARLLAHPHLARHAELYHRVGIDIASELLLLLRREEFRERALATPHTCLHALLGIVGDAEKRTDADGYMRFVLPGTEQAGGVYLDQITVPG